MILRNIDGIGGIVAGIKILGYRSAEVPNDAVFDKRRYEIMGEKPTKKPINGDLDGDGDFDKEDLAMAGKVLGKGRKKKR
jgi:hypothetical protein